MRAGHARGVARRRRRPRDRVRAGRRGQHRRRSTRFPRSPTCAPRPAPGSISTALSGSGRRRRPRFARSSKAWIARTRGRPMRTSGSTCPYDCGLAFVAHPDAHRAAMRLVAEYLVVDEKATRDAMDWTPEFSRRARGFAVYAALRSLGRSGVAELIDRCCRHARTFGDGARAPPGLRDPQRDRAQPGALPLRATTRRRAGAGGGAGERRGLDERHDLGRARRDPDLGLELAHERRGRRADARRISSTRWPRVSLALWRSSTPAFCTRTPSMAAGSSSSDARTGACAGSSTGTRATTSRAHRHPSCGKRFLRSACHSSSTSARTGGSPTAPRERRTSATASSRALRALYLRRRGRRCAVRPGRLHPDRRPPVLRSAHARALEPRRRGRGRARTRPQPDRAPRGRPVLARSFKLLDDVIAARLDAAPSPAPEIVWAWRALVRTNGAVRVQHARGQGRPQPATPELRLSGAHRRRAEDGGTDPPLQPSSRAARPQADSARRACIRMRVLRPAAHDPGVPGVRRHDAERVRLAPDSGRRGPRLNRSHSYKT